MSLMAGEMFLNLRIHSSSSLNLMYSLHLKKQLKFKKWYHTSTSTKHWAFLFHQRRGSIYGLTFGMPPYSPHVQPTSSRVSQRQATSISKFHSYRKKLVSNSFTSMLIGSAYCKIRCKFACNNFRYMGMPTRF